MLLSRGPSVTVPWGRRHTLRDMQTPAAGATDAYGFPTLPARPRCADRAYRGQTR
jgi:hypothetical protein